MPARRKRASALAVSQRELLRRAGESPSTPGSSRCQDSTQGGVGLDGDERARELRERARQLARARGDIHDVGPLGHAELLDTAANGSTGHPARVAS